VARQPEDHLHHNWLMYDFGQSTANMLLAAADLSIGSGHSAVSDQGQAQRVLGFPDGYLAVYLIGLGYPARPAATADRQAGPPAIRRRRALGPLVTARYTAGRQANHMLDGWLSLGASGAPAQ
jgi:hypothetical protein